MTVGETTRERGRTTFLRLGLGNKDSSCFSSKFGEGQFSNVTVALSARLPCAPEPSPFKVQTFTLLSLHLSETSESGLTLTV